MSNINSQPMTNHIRSQRKRTIIGIDSIGVNLMNGFGYVNPNLDIQSEGDEVQSIILQKLY